MAINNLKQVNQKLQSAINYQIIIFKSFATIFYQVIWGEKCSFHPTIDDNVSSLSCPNWQYILLQFSILPSPYSKI